MTAKLFVTICLLIACPFFADAATVSLSSTQTNLIVGDVFYLDVVLDTNTQVINAAEVTVSFPADLVSFVTSEEKNSFVSLWIEKPSVEEGGVVHFSGVTPGGVSGEGLVMTRLFFEALSEGQSPFEIQEESILLHDGLGTKIAMETRGVHITITSGEATLNPRPYFDTEPPERFVPVRTRDADLFEGKYFLVFDTQDKNAGIETYKVKEGIFDWYKKARSPYVLNHQKDDRVIWVKAIDRAGNETVVSVYPQTGVVWYQKPSVLFSILIVISSLCFLLLFYKVLRGRK